MDSLKPLIKIPETLRISHEINTPLCIISHLLIKLRSQIEKSQPYNLELLKECTQRMEDHLNRITAIIRNQEKLYEPYKNTDLQILNWKKIFSEVQKSNQELPHHSHLQLSISGMIDLNFKGHLSDLTQSLQNLIKNSCQANSEISPLRIHLEIGFEESSKSVVMTYADNGCGISEGFMSHIFEPYFTTKNEETNKGIGLYICKIIATKHRGSLELVSGNPVMFELKIPVLDI